MLVILLLIEQGKYYAENGLSENLSIKQQSIQSSHVTNTEMTGILNYQIQIQKETRKEGIFFFFFFSGTLVTKPIYIKD